MPWQIIVGPKGWPRARSRSSAAPGASARWSRWRLRSTGSRARRRERRHRNRPSGRGTERHHDPSPASNGSSPGAICARGGVRASSPSSPAFPSMGSCSASDADHRDVGDERLLPERTAREDRRRERPQSSRRRSIARSTITTSCRSGCARFPASRWRSRWWRGRRSPRHRRAMAACSFAASARPTSRPFPSSGQCPARYARRLRHRRRRCRRQAAGGFARAAGRRFHQHHLPEGGFDAFRHRAAHQGLSDPGGLRDRHDRVRRLLRFHAARRGAGLFQSRRRCERHRDLRRQSGDRTQVVRDAIEADAPRPLVLSDWRQRNRSFSTRSRSSGT